MLCKTCQAEWRRNNSAYGARCAAKFIYYQTEEGLSAEEATARIIKETRRKHPPEMNYPAKISEMPVIKKIKPSFLSKLFNWIKLWLKKLPVNSYNN